MSLLDIITGAFSRWFGSDSPKPEKQACRVGSNSHSHPIGSHVLTSASAGSQRPSSQSPGLCTSCHSATRGNAFDIVWDEYPDSFRRTTPARVSTSSGSTHRSSTSEVYDPYQSLRRNAAMPQVTTSHTSITRDSTFGVSSSAFRTSDVRTSSATGVSQPRVSTAGVGSIGVSPYRVSTAGVGSIGVSPYRASTAGSGSIGVSPYRVSTASVGGAGVSSSRVCTAGVGATVVSAHRVSTAGVNEYRVTTPDHRSSLVKNYSGRSGGFSCEQLGARTSVSSFNEVQELPVRVPTARANSAAPRGSIAALNRASLQDVENHIRSFYSEDFRDTRDLNGYGDFSGSPYFPFQDDQTVTWFRQRISRPRHAEPDGLPREMKVDMINLDLTDRHQDIAAAVAQLRRTYLGDGDEILFHATRAEAVVNILKSGIDLNMCKGRRDFSDNYGFYATPDYNKCITWALRKSRGLHGSSAAIIAFRISRQLRQEHHLMLETKTQQGRRFWRRVIKYFRLGHSSSMIQQSLNAAKYIRGPVLANATLGHTDTPHWIPFDQICICDDEYAKQFGSLNNVCFVVFFRDPDDDDDDYDSDDDEDDESEEDTDEDDGGEEEDESDEYLYEEQQYNYSGYYAYN